MDMEQDKTLTSMMWGGPWIFMSRCYQDGLTCKIPVELDSDGKTSDTSILKQVRGWLGREFSVDPCWVPKNSQTSQAICVDCDPNDHCQWGRLDIKLERRSIGILKCMCRQLVIVTFACVVYFLPSWSLAIWYELSWSCLNPQKQTCDFIILWYSPSVNFDIFCF